MILEARQSGLYADKVEFEKIRADLQEGNLNLSVIYPALSLLKQKASTQALGQKKDRSRSR